MVAAIGFVDFFFFLGGSKTAKYSKEDIERKKLEAQNRRRQKMVQSQQKHQELVCNKL